MVSGIGNSSWGHIRYQSQSQRAPAGSTGATTQPSIGKPVQPDNAGRASNAGCQTCKERTYQDGSTDPGVSMKSPTVVGPEEAFSKVSSHEQEHVLREQAKAENEGREVLMQSVKINTAVCPECGRVYISGGETQTVTRKKSEPPANDSPVGNLFDAYA